MSSNAQENDWVVTVDASHPLERVVQELVRIGMRVRQVLALGGAIIAHGTDHQASEAREVSGVIDVSKDEPIDIGPPSAKIS